MEVCRIVVYMLLALHMIMVLRIMMMVMIALTMAALMHSTWIIYCTINTILAAAAAAAVTIHLSVLVIVVGSVVSICCRR